MNPTTTVYRSRWGYHPCNHELFLKLKQLHNWYWQTLYDFHRWHRWFRRLEPNRVGPEPRYCPGFVKDSTWYKPVQLGGEPGCKVYPRTVVDHDVVELYRSARLPQAEPVPAWDAETIGRLETFYDEVRRWFDE